MAVGARGLFQPRLFQYGFCSPFVLWDRYLSRLDGVFELLVGTLGILVIPAVGEEQLFNLFRCHYDTVCLRDGREGTIVEVLGGGERFLVDVGTSPQDWETIDVPRSEIIS
nr:MAG TPA: protein of unknown function (DUF4926) [Caudoviricetes sp.]